MKTIAIILLMSTACISQVLIGYPIDKVKKKYKKFYIEEGGDIMDKKIGIHLPDGILVYYFMYPAYTSYYAALHPKSQIKTDSLKSVYGKKYRLMKPDKWLNVKDTIAITFEDTEQPHFNYMYSQ